jgi:hypothetical protein
MNDRLVALQYIIDHIYERLGYPMDQKEAIIEDVRAATLLNVKGDIVIGITNLNIIIGFEQKTITMDTVRVLGLEQLDKDTGATFLFRLSQYMQLSLVAMFQFRIENMITNILARLKKEVPRDYGQKVMALLKILSLDSNRNLKIMYILQNIRNSLHNNGIHNNASMSITIEGCAGWRHIAVAIEASLLVVEKILCTPIVKGIPPPISGAYVKGL